MEAYGGHVLKYKVQTKKNNNICPHSACVVTSECPEDWAVHHVISQNIQTADSRQQHFNVTVTNM